MVKNLPTIERSTKIRFGKHANDDQAENTIVFNASDSSIAATQSGSMYMTPLRTAEIAGSTFLGYVPGTKEVVNTGVLTSLLGGVTLESAANQGNTISNVVQYTNETTSFVTSSNVGISNTAPTHALSVKDKVFISGPTGDPDDLRIEGNTKTHKLQTGTEVTIDKNATNKIQVSGIVKTDKLHADFIGVSNIAPTNLISIGPDGQTTFNIPTHTTYALSTTGNVNAQNYRGDGGLLSNISLQTVSDKSNITSNTIILSNSDVGAKALGSIVAEGAFYGQIKGSNAIAASTVTATSFSGSGANITAIDPTNINGVIGAGAGGTGLTSFTEGDIIYANGTSSLAAVGTGSATAGQFLKLNSTKTAPEWSDVPLTLDEVLASQTGVSNVSDEVMTLSKVSGVALEIETAQLALNGSGTVLNAPNGNITAGSFAGDGSAITHLDLGDATNTGQVAVVRGGTGATTTTGTGDNVLSGSPTIDDPTITNGVVISSGGLKQNSLSLLNTPYVNSSGVLDNSATAFNPSSMVTSISSNVEISGNLTVTGNVTSQHATDHFITDNIFSVAHNNTINNKDMGQHMTRPSANVFAGFLGYTMDNEYTIAYTDSKSESQTIVPTLNTPDGYITANVWGNVLAGNVTTTGTVDASLLKGSGASITNINPANFSTVVEIGKGGTGLTSIAENELLLGPASGTALDKLSAYTGPAATILPPSGMSSSTQTIGGISYTSSASTTYSGTTTYNAFDHTNTTIWRSVNTMGESYSDMDGYYSGASTTGSYYGAWIQLYRATAIAPTSVQIIASQTTSIPAPKEWKIFGSTNGSSWTQIHSSSTAVTWNSGNGHTATISGSAAYNYLRLAVEQTTMTSSMGTVAVSELRFSAPGTGPTEKFLKSSSAGISWDSVSSTLQAITDGGATTTQTVAFNNTTTGLTSAGDIDIAATKQIDYAGDVLLKSSAGAIASFKVDNAIKLDPAYAAPTNNVLSFNTSTGEIYDSGGQGGSTLDNVHEYKANVSIGPSVASANLTVNVFESNVLTVSGNVSAESITIGSLHVAASPFSLDDVAEAHATANVTSNVLQFTGPPNTVLHDNAFITTKSIKIGSNVNATGNLISQNIQLTNPDITATMSSTNTITIDAKNKSYGTAPLVVLGGDLESLVYSNLINGAQIVVPLLANGSNRTVSKTVSNVNWYVQTADVSIPQNDQALMTVSNVAGNVYMNAITFTSGS
uniref:Uncharacterized protein n=1 Tax=Bathycoccus sp. RCC716 virus 2 TaxID=2530039 RepID=A0A7S6SX06_9PHYC|nr:hypothetical protein [Bathycoccus sp. RCC716 virus 2]